MGERSSAGAAVPPHVLLVSFPAQGHINPLLRLATRIAAKGPLVTFSSTLDIGHRIIAAAAAAAPDTPVPIDRGHLRFDFFSDEWAVDDPRRYTQDLMSQLETMGPSAVAALIRRQAELGRPVTCVINNPFLPWVLDVAEELNIPSAVLWIQSCSVFSIYYHYFHSLAEFPSASSLDLPLSLPGLPQLNPDEIPTFLLPSNPYTSILDVILGQFRNIEKASWVLANSFEELEGDAIKAISGRLPIIPVGPLVGESESEIRGDLWKTADSCIEWLDSREPNSVVYASVGSIVVLTEAEMTEMAMGLLGCGRPFLWVVREKYQSFLPEGFMEEIEGRGMVVSWSPQERVLAHGSVSCFLTHCGWNSTLEVLMAGVPVIAYPQFGDQVPNAKFMVDVYGVGVRLKAPVKRRELERCVDEVTKGEKAKRMKERAAGWRQIAVKAAAEGGSSDRNIQAFVHEITTKVKHYVGSDGGGDSNKGSVYVCEPHTHTIRGPITH